MNIDNCTTLHRAIELGRVEIVRILLSIYGSELLSRGKKGETPLHFAASIKSRDKKKIFRIVNLLLNKAYNPKTLLNVCSDLGETPLHCAVMNNKIELVKLFLKHGANINVKNRDGKTPLYFAIEQRNVEVATLLLKNRANVNLTMISGCTALHEAVLRESKECVKLLLSYRADVNAKDFNGKTPLHLAAQSKYFNKMTIYKIVKLLLNNGADVNDQSQFGTSAFQLALIWNSEKIIRLFLDYGADVNSKDCYGKSCLHHAVMRSNKSILKLLLDKGAKISDRMDDGQTALHIAIMIDNESIVKMLLEYNADVNAIDENGRTVLSYAIEDPLTIYNPWNGFYPSNMITVSDNNIFGLLIKRIAMLENPAEANIRVMTNNDKFNTFYEQCKMELRKMKTNKICDNISMYKILTEDIFKVVGYARNEKLLSVFESGEWEYEYPIYNLTLRERFYKADYRKNLLESSSINFKRLVRPYVLPELIVENILNYLKIEDLLILGMTR